MDREIGKQGERNEGNATRPAEFDFVDLMRESLLNQPVKDSELVAAVGCADAVKERKLKDGGSATSYELDGQEVYRDERHPNGVRVRRTYDIIGRQDGVRIDQPNGSHTSTFEDYKVIQDKTGTRVFKKDFDEYEPVTGEDEINQILQQERQHFQPPRVMRSRS